MFENSGLVSSYLVHMFMSCYLLLLAAALGPGAGGGGLRGGGGSALDFLGSRLFDCMVSIGSNEVMGGVTDHVSECIWSR